MEDQGISQLDYLKQLYDRRLKNGKDPNSVVMRSIRDQIASMERDEDMKKLAKEEPEIYRFIMSGVNINE